MIWLQTKTFINTVQTNQILVGHVLVLIENGPQILVFTTNYYFNCRRRIPRQQSVYDNFNLVFSRCLQKYNRCVFIETSIVYACCVVIICVCIVLLKKVSKWSTPHCNGLIRAQPQPASWSTQERTYSNSLTVFQLRVFNRVREHRRRIRGAAYGRNKNTTNRIPGLKTGVIWGTPAGDATLRMDHHHHPHPDRGNNARGGVPTHQILTPLTRHTSSAKIHPSAARGKTEKKPRSPSIVSSRDGNGGTDTGDDSDTAKWLQGR